MNVLRTKDPQRITREKINAQLQVRLFDPAARTYLHMSGQQAVENIAWAWRGHRHKANALRRCALTVGKEWPFVIVPVEDRLALNFDSSAISIAVRECDGDLPAGRFVGRSQRHIRRPSH